MAEIATYEHHFITNDGPTFNMIEDESGDIFWGYGHREADEFTNEVNRWLIHTNAVTDPDDLFQKGEVVEHLWARAHPEYGDRFVMTSESDADAFPVTRLLV